MMTMLPNWRSTRSQLRFFTAALYACVLTLPLMAQGGAGRTQPRPAFEALDLDHDGTLSAAEISAAPNSLRTLDRNGDGILTADELTGRPANAAINPEAYVTQLMAFDHGSKGYLVPSDLPERMRGVFARGDSDHDGKLTPAEIRALSAHLGMPAGNTTAPGHAEGMFRQDPILNALDTNHDGQLDAAEIAAASRSLLTLDANHDGQLTPDETRVRQQTAEERVDHLLSEWDADHDGKLSRAETPDRLAADFDNIDTNHDGFLDRAELLAWFRTHNGPQRPPAPAPSPAQP